MPNPRPIDRPDNAVGAQTFSYLINVYVPANYIWIEVESWQAYTIDGVILLNPETPCTTTMARGDRKLLLTLAREWMQKASAYQRAKGACHVWR